MTRRDGGITLLELTVVLAIFALISVMALQALRGAIRSQTGLEAAAQDNAALARALTRLRHDLEAAVPLAFTDPQGVPGPALLVAPGGAGFSVSLGGQPPLPGTARTDGFHRVEWAYDRASGVLARRLWLSLIPAQTATPGPAIVQLDGIERMEVAAFTAGGTWQVDWAPDPDGNPAALPRALRVRIESRDWGTLEVIERF